MYKEQKETLEKATIEFSTRKTISNVLESQDNKYFGFQRNSRRSNLGLVASKGSTVEGDWKRGELYGIARISCLTPDHLFLGEVEGNQREGLGILESDRFTYLGHFSQDKFNGIGLLKLAKGYELRGHFKNGFLDGYGEINSSDGALTVRGNFWRGKKDGLCIVTTQDSKKIIEFEEDKEIGLGKQICKEFQYIGGWNNGKMNGFGKLTNDEGDYYGDFRDGEKYGIALEINRTKEFEYLGTVENEKWTGFGKIITPEYTYIGAWKNGKRHGLGHLIIADDHSSSTYFGYWKNDRREGLGIYHTKNKTIKAQWKADSLDGKVLISTKKGKSSNDLTYVLYKAGDYIKDITKGQIAFSDEFKTLDLNKFNQYCDDKVIQLETMINQSKREIKNQMHRVNEDFSQEHIVLNQDIKQMRNDMAEIEDIFNSKKSKLNNFCSKVDILLNDVRDAAESDEDILQFEGAIFEIGDYGTLEEDDTPKKTAVTEQKNTESQVLINQEILEQISKASEGIATNISELKPTDKIINISSNNSSNPKESEDLSKMYIPQTGSQGVDKIKAKEKKLIRKTKKGDSGVPLPLKESPIDNSKPEDEVNQSAEEPSQKDETKEKSVQEANQESQPDEVPKDSDSGFDTNTKEIDLQDEKNTDNNIDEKESQEPPKAPYVSVVQQADSRNLNNVEEKPSIVTPVSNSIESQNLNLFEQKELQEQRANIQENKEVENDKKINSNETIEDKENAVNYSNEQAPISVDFEPENTVPDSKQYQQVNTNANSGSEPKETDEESKLSESQHILPKPETTMEETNPEGLAIVESPGPQKVEDSKHALSNSIKETKEDPKIGISVDDKKIEDGQGEDASNKTDTEMRNKVTPGPAQDSILHKEEQFKASEIESVEDKKPIIEKDNEGKIEVSNRVEGKPVDQDEKKEEVKPVDQDEKKEEVKPVDQDELKDEPHPEINERNPLPQYNEKHYEVNNSTIYLDYDKISPLQFFETIIPRSEYGSGHKLPFSADLITSDPLQNLIVISNKNRILRLKNENFGQQEITINMENVFAIHAIPGNGTIAIQGINKEGLCVIELYNTNDFSGLRRLTGNQFNKSVSVFSSKLQIIDDPLSKAFVWVSGSNRISFVDKVNFKVIENCILDPIDMKDKLVISISTMKEKPGIRWIREGIETPLLEYCVWANGDGVNTYSLTKLNLLKAIFIQSSDKILYAVGKSAQIHAITLTDKNAQIIGSFPKNADLKSEHNISIVHFPIISVLVQVIGDKMCFMSFNKALKAFDLHHFVEERLTFSPLSILHSGDSLYLTSGGNAITNFVLRNKPRRSKHEADVLRAVLSTIESKREERALILEKKEDIDIGTLLMGISNNDALHSNGLVSKVLDLSRNENSDNRIVGGENNSKISQVLISEVEDPKIENPKVENPKIENPKVENPKIENPKVEDSKIEDPKIEDTKVEDSKIENPKVEDPKIENPKVEDSKIEDPKIEDTKVEDSKIENPKVENPKIEDPKVENPKIEDPKIEDPKVENPKIEDPKVENPKIENPKIEDPKVQDPKIEDPKVEDPKVEDPKIEDPKVQDSKIENPKIEDPKIEDPKIEDPKVEDPKIENPKVENPKIENPKIEDPKVQDPKIEDPKVEDPKVQDQMKIEVSKIEDPKKEITKVEDTKVQDQMKIEVSKIEDPKKEITKVEDSNVKDPKIADTIVEDSKIQDTKVEDSIKIEDPKAEDSMKIEDPKVENPNVKNPKIEDPKVPDSKIKDPKVEDQMKIEVSKIEDPKIEITKVENPEKTEDTKVEDSNKIEAQKEKETPNVEDLKTINQPKDNEDMAINPHLVEEQNQKESIKTNDLNKLDPPKEEKTIEIEELKNIEPSTAEPPKNMLDSATEMKKKVEETTKVGEEKKSEIQHEYENPFSTVTPSSPYAALKFFELTIPLTTEPVLNVFPEIPSHVAANEKSVFYSFGQMIRDCESSKMIEVPGIICELYAQHNFIYIQSIKSEVSLLSILNCAKMTFHKELAGGAIALSSLSPKIKQDPSHISMIWFKSSLTIEFVNKTTLEAKEVKMHPKCPYSKIVTLCYSSHSDNCVYLVKDGDSNQIAVQGLTRPEDEWSYGCNVEGNFEEIQLSGDGETVFALVSSKTGNYSICAINLKSKDLMVAKIFKLPDPAQTIALIPDTSILILTSGKKMLFTAFNKVKNTFDLTHKYEYDLPFSPTKSAIVKDRIILNSSGKEYAQIMLLTKESKAEYEKNNLAQGNIVKEAKKAERDMILSSKEEVDIGKQPLDSNTQVSVPKEQPSKEQIQVGKLQRPAEKSNEKPRDHVNVGKLNTSKFGAFK